MENKRGRPAGWRKDVTRPHRVMISLSEDERGWLLSQAGGGSEGKVIRGLIEKGRAQMGNAEERQDTVGIDSHCVYCGHEVGGRTVPRSWDDSAWLDAAEGHADDCEWIATRAHSRDEK